MNNYTYINMKMAMLMVAMLVASSFTFFFKQ